MNNPPSHHESRRDVEYSVVIAAYNSSESLVELHARLVKVFSESLKATFEIIFVDDASPRPETWACLGRLRRADPNVRIFQLMKNSGQHNATMAGLHQVRGSYVVMMDDDLQHRPEEIPKMVKALRASPNADAVMAVARQRQHSTFRNLGSGLMTQLLRRSINIPEGVTITSFRLVTRELSDALIQYQGNIITLGALICSCTQRIRNVEVEHDPRKFGTSSYSVTRLLSLALSNIFNFSDLPLKVIRTMGFVFSGVACLYAVLILYQKLTGRIGQAGFATITILISFYSGLLLFSIGTLGQYVMRILRTTTAQHQFIIRDNQEHSEGPSQ